MTSWIGSINSPVDIEVLEESALARAQATIQKAIDQACMSKADVARAMGRNRSFVTRMLSGDHNLTVKTMTRALAVCGFEVHFEPVPLVWSWEESEQVEHYENTVPAYAGTPMPTEFTAVGIGVPA